MVPRCLDTIARAVGSIRVRARAVAAARIGSVLGLKAAEKCHIFCTRNMTLDMGG